MPASFAVDDDLRTKSVKNTNLITIKVSLIMSHMKSTINLHCTVHYEVAIFRPQTFSPGNFRKVWILFCNILYPYKFADSFERTFDKP